jgi:hypothetical protein
VPRFNFAAKQGCHIGQVLLLGFRRNAVSDEYSLASLEVEGGDVIARFAWLIGIACWDKIIVKRKHSDILQKRLSRSA